MESDMGCLRWGWREEGIRESNRLGSGLALPVTVVEARQWVRGVDLPFLDFEYIWVFPTIVCRKKRQGKQKEKAWRKTSRAGEGGQSGQLCSPGTSKGRWLELSGEVWSGLEMNVTSLAEWWQLKPPELGEISPGTSPERGRVSYAKSSLWTTE